MMLPGRPLLRWFILAAVVLGTVSGWRLAQPASPSLKDQCEQATPETMGSEAGPLDEHLARLRIDRALRAGWRGQRIKIAVLDSGFRGYRSFLGRGLPARIDAKSFRTDGNLEARASQHGILCGEVVHALAPDAQVLFANWDGDHPDSFLQAVRWAKAQGARVCSCSLIMPSWSDGDGGGRIHAELARILGAGQGAGDMVFCACAGNIAQRHWLGKLAPDERGAHQWHEGKINNRLTPWGPERALVEMYGPLTATCVLQVWSGQQFMGEARLQPQADARWSKATVRVDPKAGQAYQVRVLWQGDALPQEKFHVVALGGYLDYVVAEGSIPFPGDGACVVTVGAVDAQGRRMHYSSCGPNSHRPKPDVVAPVPFPSHCRDKPFSGTSAAAPQAAALAALIWSGHPDWTAREVVQALREHALDLGPPGHDFETGFGLLRLP